MTQFIDNYEVKEDYGSKWLKIFYHNASNHDYFNDAKDALLSLNNKNKYSILKYLPRIHTFEYRKFEFLLEYPGLKGYNRWKQTSNPTKNNDVYGYEAVESQITWPWYFVGLRKYDSSTFLAGCSKPPGWWHFAVGSYTYYSSNNTFPGPTTSSSSNHHIKEAYLWVRVANFSDMISFRRVSCRAPKNTYVSSLLLMMQVILS